MERLLSNPAGLLALCCVGALIVGFNLTLLGVLRGDKRVQAEASRWTRAFGGGRATERRQMADYDELHRRVADIQAASRQAGDEDSTKDG